MHPELAFSTLSNGLCFVFQCFFTIQVSWKQARVIFIVVLIVYDFSYGHILGGRFDVGKTCLTPPHFYAPVLSQKNVGHRFVFVWFNILSFIIRFMILCCVIRWCYSNFGAIQSLLNGVDFHLLKTIW